MARQLSGVAASGDAVICAADGSIVESWGNPDQVILPRSSVKMLQALPLLESGAADAAGLGDDRLALACASHQGAPVHTALVQTWLAGLGLDDDAFRCGLKWSHLFGQVCSVSKVYRV